MLNYNIKIASLIRKIVSLITTFTKKLLDARKLDCSSRCCEIVTIAPTIYPSSWHLQNSESMPLSVGFCISFIKFTGRLLIATFSFVRTSFHPTYLRRSFCSVSNRSWRFFASFSSLSTASFRHPLVSFLRTRLKTRRPSVKWDFDGGVFDNLFIDNLQNQLCSWGSAHFQLVKLTELLKYFKI